MVIRQMAVVSAMVLTGATAQAQELTRGFEPGRACGEILRGATDLDRMMVAAWSYGFLAAVRGENLPVHLKNNQMILRNLTKACAQDETVSLLALLQTNTAKQDSETGSIAQARATLRKFMDPQADLSALTAALAPTEADIRAVYGDPLAGKLVQMYSAMFKPGARIGPKAEQTELRVVWATTGALKRGDAILDQFPGGYKDVLPHFVGDQPIVRFKFVKPGESLGLAFDGLIFVNGRWVLMPKPWRGLN